MGTTNRAEELVWKKKFPNEEFDFDNYYDWARENSKEAYNIFCEVSQSEIDSLTKEVERLRKERELSRKDRLFHLANEFAGDELGHIAVKLHSIHNTLY